MLDFFKKLLPNFDKRRLIHQHDSVKQTLADIVIPMLESFVNVRVENPKILHNSAYAKQFIKEAQRRLNRNVPASTLKEYETILTAVSTATLSKLSIIRKYIDDLFNEQVASNGLTFKQVEVIRLLDLMSFFNTYSVKLSHYAGHEDFVKTTGIKVDSPLTPAELKWLNENHKTFIDLCAIFTMKEVDFNTIIQRTSELEVTEAEGNAVVLGTHADPMKLGFMPGVGSLILFIRENWLAYEVNKYEAAKLRLQSLQLQLQQMKQRQSENPEDAALARQIEYYNNRIKQLEVEIHKFEEKAGV